jgi:hypothetical protein
MRVSSANASGIAASIDGLSEPATPCARLGDVLRRADAGDHVLALGVDQEFAVELFLAGRGIAREGDAGRRGLAHIAEHHGLHVDRGAPAFRNVVQPPIGDGALVHPGAEHRADRAPQLRVRILRKKISADLSRNREAWWNGQPKPCHFSEIGALATEKVSQAAFSFGLALAEGVNPFCHRQPFAALPRCDQTGGLAREISAASPRLLYPGGSFIAASKAP